VLPGTKKAAREPLCRDREVGHRLPMSRKLPELAGSGVLTSSENDPLLYQALGGGLLSRFSPRGVVRELHDPTVAVRNGGEARSWVAEHSMREYLRAV